MNLWGRQLPSWCWRPWCSWMEVSEVSWAPGHEPGIPEGMDSCHICFPEGRPFVFFPCSYSALCAPAIPGAARGKHLGNWDLQRSWRQF